MKIKVLSLLLIILGLISSFGHIIKNDTIKGIGVLSVASPLPIVFTQHKGIETFTWDFFITYEINSTSKELQITPDLYSKLNKPYNYKNVIGAAISYAPLLPEELVQSVLYYSFINPAPLTKAIGLAPLKNAHIKIVSKTANKNLSYILPIGGQR